MAPGMKIGEFAKQLGTSAKTVRYYEALGLLEAAERSDAGYRLYSERDAERLRFVLGAKALGLGLTEIGEIVAAWVQGERPCAHVGELLARKLAALDHRIAELQRFRDELAAYKERVEAQASTPGAPCDHIEGVAAGRWTTPLPAGGTWG